MSTASKPDPRFSPGVVLSGKFRVVGVLGQGGMGIVLAAHHLVLDQPVALKILLPPEEGEHQQAVERFIREARALAQLHSAHIARVLDVGALEDGLPFMVMELLDGEDLQSTLEREGFLPVAVAVSAILHACDALAEAHGRGLVHRDLKPANLFLARTPEGRTVLKIIDFGIAKSTVRADHSLTATKSMIGSPLYMSPEQVKSPKAVDTRSDIWALGCVLYELVIGRPPFLAETIGEIFAAILQAPLPSASAQNYSVPPELDAVIERCLARELGERFQTVQELATALHPFASPEALRARGPDESAPRLVMTGSRAVVPGRAAPAASGITMANTVVQTDASGPKRGSATLKLAGAAVAAAVVGVIALAGTRLLRPFSGVTTAASAPSSPASGEVFAPLVPPEIVLPTASPETPASPAVPASSGAPAGQPVVVAKTAAPARSVAKPASARAPAVVPVKAGAPAPSAPAKRPTDVLEGRD